MNKILMGSMIVVAAALSGCEVSTAEDEKVASCDMNSSLWGLVSIHICMDSKDQSYVDNYCREEREDIYDAGQSAEASAVSGTGCPSGAKKTCNVVVDGVPVTIYAYDDASAQASCEELSNKM